MTDTIFALASGRGRAGVAVVRVSGPKAARTLEMLTGAVPPPRAAQLAHLKDGRTPLDRALVIYFKGPASFTGEDVAEYHLHGGRAVVEGVLRALSKVPGCRLAEPGEFTRRAFENGKMDLTEAEAVADLIHAETEAQRLQALDQLEGGLSQLYGGWAGALKNILAHQEADLEFPDEDLPVQISDTLKPDIAKLRDDLSSHLDDNHRGERLRDGVRVVLFGAPNAGKSSLLNALARRDAAIVSDEAGTTRDVIEVHLDLGGYPVILSDTAGLRGAEGKVEAEGIRRAKDAAARADLRVALFDSTAAPDAATQALVDDRTMVVFTKRDLLSSPSPRTGGHQQWLNAIVDAGVRGGATKTDVGLAAQPLTPTLSPPVRGEGEFSLSSLTGEGMEAFLTALTARVAALFDQGSGPPLTRARHRAALEEARDCLDRCLAAPLPELAAEDLRLSLRALGRITGKVHVEELLDAIFRDFCIGK